jgi:KAP family P-loop domain-containing protein
MQLVKSIANFNNVIYLLSYDKKIVENALMEEFHSDHYLDKIIQVSFSIPIIPNFIVAEFCLIQLRQFIQNNAQRYSIDDIESIQYNLRFLSSFFRELKTVRDVKRFINMFQVDFEIFHSNIISLNYPRVVKKRLEFDFNEFVLIELLKFSNRKFYKRIYWNI